jgi:hypothetical protein
VTQKNKPKKITNKEKEREEKEILSDPETRLAPFTVAEHPS